MNKYRKEPKLLKMELTPLIDIVFLLLIFFMVTTTFSDYGKYDIQLPKSDITELTKSKSLEIVINSGGEYFIMEGKDEKPILLKDVPTLVHNNSDVIISGDEDVRYQNVVDVIGAIKKGGVDKIGLNFSK